MRSCTRVATLFGVFLALFAFTAAAAAAPGTARPSFAGARMHALMAPRAFWTHASWTAQGVDPIGPFALSGTVLDYDGTPSPGADVEWGWYDPNAPSWFGSDVVGHDGGSATTGDDGTFAFPGVTSVPGSDYLGALRYGDAGWSFQGTWDNDFSSGASHVIRPGRVPVNLLHAPGSADFLIVTGDAATGNAVTELQADQPAPLADTAPPGFVTALVQAQSARGTVPAAVGWVSPGHAVVPVTPGQEAATTLDIDWDDAVRGRLAGPYPRHSGPAGSQVTFVLDDWPAGMQVSFEGSSFAGGGTDWFAPVVTSQGPDETYRARFTIPEDARAGAIYAIDAYRSDDPAALLYLTDYFLVCDFGASRSVIDRGQAVRLHGRVDGGSVTLFKRTSPAPQPAKLSAPGWIKVRSFETRTGGRFRTGFMRPERTTWYVARYSGLDFPAFTQVIKVTVRND